MKILVVLNDSHLDRGVDSPLLQKSIALAEQMGASLELLQVVHDISLESSPFLDEDPTFIARDDMMAGTRASVEKLAGELAAEGVAVHYEVRWDTPRGAAIVRKVLDDGADLVIKEARERHALLGLFSNADWDLLRDSPVPVWFVKSECEPDDGVIAAVELLNKAGEVDSPALDHDVFRHARAVAEAYDSTLTVVHAYKLPVGVTGFSSYAPLYAGDSAAGAGLVAGDLTEMAQKGREQIARRHGAAIEKFAKYFALDREKIVVREGEADDVISEEAHRRNVGLVVMGAGEVGFLDRLFHSTTAESTLAEADCDILFVKSVESAFDVAVQAEQALHRHRSDRPETDVFTQILGDPSAHFKSPAEVAKSTEYSNYEKRRILRVWEQESIQMMIADEEGIFGGEPAMLQEVREALRTLIK